MDIQKFYQKIAGDKERVMPLFSKSFPGPFHKFLHFFRRQVCRCGIKKCAYGFARRINHLNLVFSLFIIAPMKFVLLYILEKLFMKVFDGVLPEAHSFIKSFSSM